MNKLLKLLPPYERSSKILQEITTAEGAQFDKLDLELQDFKKQFYIDTATWVLSLHERDLGLLINPDLDIKIRRSIIKARFLMQPPGSKKKLVAILKSFIETAEIEEYFSEYRFDVILKTRDTVGEKLLYMQQIVDDFKPAHLAYIFVICYLFYPKILIDFNRWLSEKFKICGTEDIYGNGLYSTLGRAYGEHCRYFCGEWLSDVFQTVSEDKTIKNEGRSYKSKSIYLFHQYLPEKLLVVSENETIVTLGKAHKSQVAYDSQAFLSAKMLVPENTGKTYKDKVKYSSLVFASAKMRLCSENTYAKEVAI